MFQIWLDEIYRTISRSIYTQPADLNPSHFLIRRQMAQDTCIPWCNEAFVFTYSHPYLYSIYIAVKSETYIKPSTTSEQTICRPINDSRSRPTALSFLVQTQYSNVSESDKYIFTNSPGLQIQTSDRLLLLDIVCVCVFVSITLKAMQSNMWSHILPFLHQDYIKKEIELMYPPQNHVPNYIVEKLNKQAIHLNEENKWTDNTEIDRQTTKSLCRVFSSVHVERTRETEEENKEMRPMLHLRRLPGAS